MFIHYSTNKLIYESDKRSFIIEGSTTWFKGYFFVDDIFYIGESAANFLYKLYISETLENKIGSCNGIFTFIIVDRDNILICNDRFGFGQLFYKFSENEFYISDDYWLLQKRSESKYLDPDSILEILQIRYVLGERTLIRDLQWIQPSSIYWFIKNENNYKLERKEYWNFKYNPQNFTLEDGSREVYITLDRIIKKYIKTGCMMNGISMNLTGGLDSRYLLAIILQNGINPTNIKTYTYGSSYCDDIKITKHISSEFGIQHCAAIFNQPFNDFFDLSTIYEILQKIGYTTSYLQGHGISKIRDLYEGVEFLLTGSDGYFIGLMSNMELFSIQKKSDLVNYIYKKNATILNPTDLSFIYKNQNIDFEKNLKAKIFNSLSVQSDDYISAFFDWTIKNRLRKYILSIYEILSDKATPLFPFYDYDFIDCMAKMPFLCLQNQNAYFDSLFRYAIDENSKKLMNIPIEANRFINKKADRYSIVIKKESLIRKLTRKTLKKPDKAFAFPIFNAYQTNKKGFLKMVSPIFHLNSEFVNTTKIPELIKKYRRNEHFFRYGLLAVFSVTGFEQLIKQKIENKE